MNIVKIIIVTLLLFASIGMSVAIPVEKWNKKIEIGDNSYFNSFQLVKNGGYIFAGQMNFNSAIVKTDKNGNISWNKTYDILNDSFFSYVQLTTDGGFILAGSTKPFDTFSDNGLLVKTDKDGNELWSKYFGGEEYDSFNVVRQTSDDGYIIVGESNSYSDNIQDIWLVKIDKDGNEMWNKTLSSNYDSSSDIKITSDGGYIITGSSGITNGLIFKVDSYGNKQWTKIFETKGRVSSIQQTSDGGYIATGYTPFISVHQNRGVGWIAKLTKKGKITWKKSIKHGSYNEIRSVRITKDGGYMIAGSMANDGLDGLLVKFNKKGKELWVLGDDAVDEFQDVIETSKNKYTIFGYTDPYPRIIKIVDE